MSLTISNLLTPSLGWCKTWGRSRRGLQAKKDHKWLAVPMVEDEEEEKEECGTADDDGGDTLKQWTIPSLIPAKTSPPITFRHQTCDLVWSTFCGKICWDDELVLLLLLL